jgi:alpha-1,2-glucosyltransferase
MHDPAPMPSLRQWPAWLTWFCFLGVYAAVAQYTSTAPRVPDESLHYGYIDHFYHGDFSLNDRVAMIPGYHALVAGILKVVGIDSLAAARIVNALFGLCAIGAFYAVRQRAVTQNLTAATMQFALLPILMPLDFLVYTDVLSLALVLGACALTLRGKHIGSATLLLAAMCVRQTNCVWIPLLWFWAAWDMRSSLDRSLVRILLRTLPYLIDILAFLVFWIWNGSIAFSQYAEIFYPDVSFHTGNVFFALFAIAILLPLHVASGLADGARKLPSQPWLILIPITVFATYWWSFHVDHPWNTQAHPVFLRNYIVARTEMLTSQRIAFGVVATAGLVGLARTPLRPASAVLLYPVAALALCAMWLIEPRYALIPLSLWLALREPASTRIEYATTALWAMLSAALLFGTFTGRFTL